MRGEERSIDSFLAEVDIVRAFQSIEKFSSLYTDNGSLGRVHIYLACLDRSVYTEPCFLGRRELFKVQPSLL
jgi:hypothetical protein